LEGHHEFIGSGGEVCFNILIAEYLLSLIQTSLKQFAFHHGRLLNLRNNRAYDRAKARPQSL